MQLRKSIWPTQSKKLYPFKYARFFLNDKEQTKAELVTRGRKTNNLRTELQKNRNNVVEGTSKPADPNQKEKENKRLLGFVVL